MGLDINTENGRLTLEDELDAQALLERLYPKVTYVHTPKDREAVVDSALVKDCTIIAVGAMRCCRKYDLETFQTRFRHEMLISLHKVLNGVELAESLCVPFVGMLYFVQDRALMIQRIWSPEGGYAVRFRVDKTETQKTVNGGRAIRDNAYIDMRGAKLLLTEPPATEQIAS